MTRLAADQRSERIADATFARMPRLATTSLTLIYVLCFAACSGAAPSAPNEPPSEPNGPPSAEVEPAEPTPAERAAARNCGNSPGDWCASPAGDPCGVHHNAGACGGDSHCEGRPYTGESFVACQLDDRCFATNCPTVGCVQRCEQLPERACRANAPRCRATGSGAAFSCARAEPCASTTPAPSETDDVPPQVDS